MAEGKASIAYGTELTADSLDTLAELAGKGYNVSIKAEDLPEGIVAEYSGTMETKVPVEYQLQELYRRVRELEENLQRLTNHINREIGVAKDEPLFQRLEKYDGHFARIKELTKLIS